MTSHADDGADLVAAAVTNPETHGAVEVAGKTSYAPWHLPRKQLCRFEQWLTGIDALRRELYTSREPGRNFRYLSLPGDELLDLRVLTKAFGDPEGPQIAFTGFNAMGGGPRRAESDLSLNELRAHPAIVREGSVVLDRRIEEVGEEDSVGYREFLQRAPFDAVNLDLTSSVGSDPPLTAGSVMQAISNILHAQINNRREPWLLFLTTPLGRPPRMSEGALRQLHGPLLKNARQTEFRTGMAAVLDLAEGSISGGYEALAGLDEGSFARVIALALSKWFVGLATERPDPWDLTLTSLYVYRVAEPSPDMFSFAFRFAPVETHAVDSTGLTLPVGSARPGRSELEVALGILDAMGETQDIDRTLTDDPAVLQQAISLTEQMLLDARFDVAPYRDWALTTMRERGLV